ncbi:MAG: hypothetical protein FJ100_05005 [Deltaproteobacteria bacterium]|nr:hypothetical protein [Deltaproteobacteria bacterium]
MNASIRNPWSQRGVRDRPTLPERVAAREQVRRGGPPALAGTLPPACGGECYALTATGQRLTFADARALVDHVRRNRDISAVCLDGCAWRTFASFWSFVRMGVPAQDAFERADLTGLGSRNPVMGQICKLP